MHLHLSCDSSCITWINKNLKPGWVLLYTYVTQQLYLTVLWACLVLTGYTVDTSRKTYVHVHYQYDNISYTLCILYDYLWWVCPVCVLYVICNTHLSAVNVALPYRMQTTNWHRVLYMYVSLHVRINFGETTFILSLLLLLFITLRHVHQERCMPVYKYVYFIGLFIVLIVSTHLYKTWECNRMHVTNYM